MIQTGTVRRIEADRAFVHIGGPACRVCGGGACVRPGRYLSCRVDPSVTSHGASSLTMGDVVELRTSPGAATRAAVRLFVVPVVLAAAGVLVTQWVGIAASAVWIVAVLIRGGGQADAPVIVRVVRRGATPAAETLQTRDQSSSRAQNGDRYVPPR